MVATRQFPELAGVLSIPNGAPMSRRARGRMVAEGMLSGASDLFLPVARRGFHGLFMEVKKKDGRVSPDQKAFIVFVTEQGYFAKVVFGLDELIETTRWYLTKEDTE